MSYIEVILVHIDDDDDDDDSDDGDSRDCDVNLTCYGSLVSQSFSRLLTSTTSTGSTFLCVNIYTHFSQMSLCNTTCSFCTKGFKNCYGGAFLTVPSVCRKYIRLAPRRIYFSNYSGEHDYDDFRKPFSLNLIQFQTFCTAFKKLLVDFAKVKTLPKRILCYVITTHPIDGDKKLLCLIWKGGAGARLTWRTECDKPRSFHMIRTDLSETDAFIKRLGHTTKFTIRSVITT